VQSSDHAHGDLATVGHEDTVEHGGSLARQRVRERPPAVTQHGLAVRDEDMLDG
jgi:hypothetical protein